MRIVNLVENTEGRAAVPYEHGLSFYIETKNHKILMDTGASDLFISNAVRLGVDLGMVDTVVISHGHYDHGGGLLAFANMNYNAKIYIQRMAFGEFYSKGSDQSMRYIGLAPKVRDIPQLEIVDGNLEIDDELSIFAGIGSRKIPPLTNRRLFVKRGDEYVNDDFVHEQCLVINENGRTVLFSGCAHHGILNTLDRYRDIYGDEPDAVFTGLHTLRKNGYTDEDMDYAEETAKELTKLSTSVYTCHCTGIPIYNAMKRIMGEQISYIHCGDELTTSSKSLDYRVHRKFRKITRYLIDRKLSIATMESCTGGMIASLLTDTEGSSEVFKGAFVAYSNEAKIMNGVPEETIRVHGVYSYQTAEAMANTAAKFFGADIAIGITGTFGNADPANSDSIPGEVYFALSSVYGNESFKASFPSQESRYEYKMLVAEMVGDNLLRMFEENDNQL